MPLASLIGRWAMKPFSKALPPLGDTERAALEAGTVGFEGQLFAGRPDFDALAAFGPNRLTEREQAFLDRTMIDLDGTDNKGRLGANATLAVAMAVARAAAEESGLPPK